MTKLIPAVAVCSLLVSPAYGDDESLKDKVARLEKRVATLESLLLESGLVSAEEIGVSAERALTLRRSQLDRLRQLRERGLVGASEVADAELSVVQAQRMLLLAQAAGKPTREILELGVKQAEMAEAIAKLRLEHTTVLAKRGLKPVLEVQAAELDMTVAVARTKSARQRLAEFSKRQP